METLVPLTFTADQYVEILHYFEEKSDGRRITGENGTQRS